MHEFALAIRRKSSDEGRRRSPGAPTSPTHAQDVPTALFRRRR